MLYTQSQLVSYAAYCLKQHGVKDEHGQDITPSHATRANWEDEKNIQPLQVGQEFTLKTVDGLEITAQIEAITEGT